MSNTIIPIWTVLFWALLTSVSPASPPAGSISIYGDSTGRGDGAQVRWHTRIADLLARPLEISNASVSRQDMRRLRNMVSNRPASPDAIVVIYDRRNAGEEPDRWMALLAEAMAALPTTRVLIMPQVPISGGREDPVSAAKMATINDLLRRTYPDNSFDAALEQRLLAALSGDETRSDKVHRNDAGQQIEAEFIAGWLIEQGWVEAADDAGL